MAKTETLHMRIDADLKSNAEYLLNQLGMSTTEAVSIFLRQVILNRGLPFEVKIPSTRPVNVAELTETELNTELEKGYADILEGRTKSAKQAFADIRKDYSI